MQNRTGRQKNLSCAHLCTKAFDKVKHEQIIHIYGKDLRIIKNLYWKQTLTVKMDNEISNFQQIKRDVVYYPLIYSLSLQRDDYASLRSIQIGGHHINNLR